MDEIGFPLVLMAGMALVLNWVYFFDWMGLIGWILSLIAPEKSIKEIETNRRMRKNNAYKRHLLKWKLLFLLAPLGTALVMLLFAWLTEKSLLSAFIALLFLLVVYRILCKHESRERSKIGDKGDKSQGNGFA